MSTLVTPLNGLLIGPTPQIVLRVPHRVPLLHDRQPIHGAHHAIGMNSLAAASAWGLRACGPSRGLGPVLSSPSANWCANARAHSPKSGLSRLGGILTPR